MLWRCMRNRLRGWRLRSELATVKTSQFFAEKQLAATAPAPHLADKDVSANALAVHAEQTARLAAQPLAPVAINPVGLTGFPRTTTLAETSVPVNEETKAAAVHAAIQPTGEKVAVEARVPAPGNTPALELTPTLNLT